MWERLIVAPGQLKMSFIFPVLLLSTSPLDHFLSGQNKQLTEASSQHVTQKNNVDVIAPMSGQNAHYPVALRSAPHCHIFKRESPYAGWLKTMWFSIPCWLLWLNTLASTHSLQTPPKRGILLFSILRSIFFSYCAIASQRTLHISSVQYLRLKFRNLTVTFLCCHSCQAYA